MKKEKIVVNILVRQPLNVVWECWTAPEHIKQWNIPFPNWLCPDVMNDIREGGSFCFKMQTKDGKEGFEHAGTYDKVIPCELVEYTLDDGRRSSIEFLQIDANTVVRESFEPEELVPDEIQEAFCQSVLQKFKGYVEQG